MFVCVFLDDAYAVDYTECPDCYRCVSYSSTGCKQCVYDENYCMVSVPECPEGKQWDASQGKCVCANICVGGQNPDTCECEDIVCDDGQYHNGLGGLFASCLDCPALDDCASGPHSNDGNSITDCYYSPTDLCTDSAGTYFFDNNCYYDNTLTAQ